MPTIAYVSKVFRASSLAVIEKANEILAEYGRQGYVLTLRQLYYQFVARGLIPNTQRSYKRLGSIINDARLAGLVDWDHLVDRTRNLQENSHWDSPEDIVGACARQFRVDMWEGQEYRPEVWIEKDALIGVIEAVCVELDVPYFSCRGYVSQSEVWGAGQRLADVLSGGQTPVVFHLGDHDPSGIDMTRDNNARLNMFIEEALDPIRRLALSLDQVREYNLPPNPAKQTDARFIKYVEELGIDNSWELDALEPKVINDLIRKAILELRDPGPWQEQAEKQAQGRAEIAAISENWEQVAGYAADIGEEDEPA